MHKRSICIERRLRQVVLFQVLISLIVLVSISLASVTMRLVVMFGCDDCLNSDSEERGKEGLGAAQVDEEPPRTQACVSC